ncbi:sugar phosphate nucleotidyltransferase [Trichocoleus sp. AS-A1]|nr:MULTISPECIES: sugar phosphate nucleotidyltransferase [unclassified Coleofasciculus]
MRVSLFHSTAIGIFMIDSDRIHQREVIGLLPAGGQATRISPLPMSKELYPIGFRPVDSGSGTLRPKVVSHYLLEKMRLAGIKKAYTVLRPGKWDIPAYFGDGTLLDMNLGYLMLGLPYGVPYTLDQAYPFVQDAVVALGFPDILFQPEDAFVRLLARLAAGNADAVLGLFPNDQPHKAGMVDFDAQGRVHFVVEKPPISDLKYMWAIAVWTPVFTQFMHEYLAAIQAGQLPQAKELPISDVVQAAIDSGLRVEAETFADGTYLDIGTPADLVKAVRQFAADEIDI